MVVVQETCVKHQRRQQNISLANLQIPTRAQQKKTRSTGRTRWPRPSDDHKRRTLRQSTRNAKSTEKQKNCVHLTNPVHLLCRLRAPCAGRSNISDELSGRYSREMSRVIRIGGSNCERMPFEPATPGTCGLDVQLALDSEANLT